MRIHYFLFSLFISLFFIPGTTNAQNFEETWKEFLENDKISNMSRLGRPDKRYEQEEYAQFLLMSTNNNFCQSKQETAETMMAELKEMDSDVKESIPGFERKMKDLDVKLKAYHKIDKIWKRFLETRDVTVEELEEVYPPSTICEKQTLVKYSYMTAHYYLCSGDFEKAKKTFVGRTLKIAEKTTLRVKDVEGMAPEVAKMKKLFLNIDDLDEAWDTYVVTGVSPGFNVDMPDFPCFPEPKIKELILKGAADICGSGAKSVRQLKKLDEESGLMPGWEVEEKMEELTAAVEENQAKQRDLNTEWNVFLKTNRIKNMDYGYEYCDKESLIRAHIMDGYAFVCETADEALFKIDSLQKSVPRVRLDKTTKDKIRELRALKKQYLANGSKIDRLWEEFVSQGDTLIEDFDSTDKYCDHIQEVKDWTMKGLSAHPKEGIAWLEKIDDFTQTFEFKLYKELECRVQKLRIRIWDYRYNLLVDLAKFQAEGDAEVYDEKLSELMAKYEMSERPEVCSFDD